MTKKQRDAIRKWFEQKNIPSLNSELFREDNHRDNNTIIFYFDDIANGYGMCGAKSILGYTDHPVFRECNGYGIMFESYNGEDFWCHISELSMEIRADVDEYS